MKTLLAVRHIAFEDLGSFEASLKAAGYDIRYADIGVDDVAGFGTPDLLAVMGGPIGAYDDDLYPYLKNEIDYVRERLEDGRPTLGICLGAQLMARALGARVYPGHAKEIGFKPLTLTPDGETLLAPLENLPVLHWHGDTFDLPAGAVNLARTDICDHQAFSLGRHGLAFQFHPEAQEAGFERWLIGHTGAISATDGVSVPQLRDQMRRYGGDAKAAGRAVLASWLAQLDAADR